MRLNTSYLGLELAHPFILGSSPLTGHLDGARRLEDGGCAAIVMHSLFEEEIAEASSGSLRAGDRERLALEAGLAPFARPERFPLRPDEYLELLHRIKAAVSIPVIGSLNGIGGDGWLNYARLMQEAGADAVEWNPYYLATDGHASGPEIEQRVAALLAELKDLVQIPVAVKLSPFFTALANLAGRLDAAGADGLVLFNRFYQPDLDIETLEVMPNLHLSTSAELLPRLHWTAVLADRVRASIAVTGGVHTVVDGIKALLSGAHAVQLVSAVIQHGPEHFRQMADGLRWWMTRHGHESVEAFRGRMSLRSWRDAARFERAGYLRVLRGWAG